MSELLGRWGNLNLPIPISAYPDNTPAIFSASTSAPSALLLRPRNLTNFFAALFYVDALQARGLRTPRLILPLVPGSRQDRLNPHGDYLFTLKSIASAINSRGFPEVVIIDPHSDVTPALIERCRVIQPTEFAPTGSFAAVIAPDAGAAKRASAVAAKLNIPCLQAWKHRNVETGELSNFGLQAHTVPKNSNVLVVDDICDGGGTFLPLADLLIQQKLVPTLLISHGLFTKGTTDLAERFKAIYTTDSVLATRENVIELNICERLLKNGI